MKIGMFDSGVGGISVLHSALRMLDTPEYLYVADTEHAPYGTKSTEEIRAYADHIVRFLVAQGADAIVVACNTATSAAIGALRRDYALPVIGMEPAVKPALALPQQEGRDRVLVLATPLTIAEEKLDTLIKTYDADHRVQCIALPELVRFAEAGVFAGAQVDAYLEEAFRDTDCARVCAVVPGCTHFLFFTPAIRRFFAKDTAFVDGNEGTVRRLADVCGLQITTRHNRTDKAPHRVTYFQSGTQVTDPETLARYDAMLARMDEIITMQQGG